MAVNAKRTAEKPDWQQENELRYKELTDKLEAGLQNMFSSEKYKEYLKSMSHFHNYSSRNVMLIHQQLPGATRVASFKLWKEKFNRHVKKGETSLRIFAPIERKPETKLMEKLDPNTGKPMLDKDGKVIMEEMTALSNRSISFKLVPVFDVSQTYGEPLPQLAEDLTGNVEHYEAFLDTLREVSPLPIVFEEMPPEKDGYCRFGEQIGIREGMSEIQTVSAIVHEITHAKLHDKNKLAEDALPTAKSVKEIEAESVSYVVCQKYGIETGDNSFGYLATWAGHDLKEVQSSLDTIRKEANDLINAIDSRLMAICKERGIDLSQPGQAQPATTTEPPSKPKEQAEPTFTTETRTESIAGVDFELSEIKPSAPNISMEHQNFHKLADLFPQMASGEYLYQRMEVGEAMMPLSLEWIGDNQLSIMHTYVQNGDLMYDPMMVFEVDRETKTASAVEFQQSNPPLYQRIEDGTGMSVDGNGNEKTINGLQGQLNGFASQWFENIGNQGYEPVNAILRDAGHSDPSVFWNAEQKPFSLHFSYDAEGTTVRNNLDRDDNGNMAKVAYVDSYRNVEFFEENLPKNIVMIVENVKLINERTEQEKLAAKAADTPDIDKQEPDVELGFGPDEKGVSVWDWNKTQDENGNERFIAHINFDREVTHLIKNLPEDIKSDIQDIADGDWKEMFAIEMAGMDYDPPPHPKDRQSEVLPEPSTTEQSKPITEQISEQMSEPMPDPTITAAERDAYGYTAEDILPLNAERAVELFNNDHAVFLLYPDNTEAMAFDVEEIKAHDGIFGMEREDWQKSQEYRDMAADNKTNQQQEAAVESDFINAKEDTFAIYQIMDGAENARDYRFEGLDYLNQQGIEVNRNNYVIVHTEPLQEGQALDAIFQKFNIDPPKDFSGHSLSVSDVVVLNQGGEITSHYVDSFGFTELPAFLGVEKQAEVQIEAQTEMITATAEQDGNVKPTTPAARSQPEKPDITDSPKSELPIYRFSVDHAMQADEIQAFHESRRLNIECGNAIDNAITASNYEMYRYDLKTAAREVVDEFGADRVAWVLASNVSDADYDGRLSNKNKAWAKEFDTPKPDVYLQTHKSILDGFVDRFRAIEKEKPSLMTALDAGEKKSKAEFDGKAKPGLDAPDVSAKKKKTGMEV